MTEFSRLYFQNYSFIYCLDINSVTKSNTKLDVVLKDYELRSGLSYVNIYGILKNNIEKVDEPIIKSIKYASPGWIELLLNPEVAIQIAKILGVYLGCPVIAAKAYKSLYKIYRDLAVMRQEMKNSLLKLKKEEVKLVKELNKELAEGLAFNSLDTLIGHTKDEEETSKLLMAHYRRITKMAKFVENGKAKFPE